MTALKAAEPGTRSVSPRGCPRQPLWRGLRPWIVRIAPAPRHFGAGLGLARVNRGRTAPDNPGMKTALAPALAAIVLTLPLASPATASTARADFQVSATVLPSSQVSKSAAAPAHHAVSTRHFDARREGATVRLLRPRNGSTAPEAGFPTHPPVAAGWTVKFVRF